MIFAYCWLFYIISGTARRWSTSWRATSEQVSLRCPKPSWMPACGLAFLAYPLWASFVSIACTSWWESSVVLWNLLKWYTGRQVHKCAQTQTHSHTHSHGQTPCKPSRPITWLTLKGLSPATQQKLLDPSVRHVARMPRQTDIRAFYSVFCHIDNIRLHMYYMMMTQN